MMFDPRAAALLVVTHNRPELLRHTLSCWAEQEFRRTVLLANHEDGFRHVVSEGTIVVQTGQHPEHPGSMCRSWNLGWQWAFNDPDVRWVVCSQDDVVVRGDWRACVAKREADFYNAPGGDVIMLLSRHAARTVGWFDERFVVTGFHEWDWIARAVLALGEDRIVSEDRHGWQYNPVGLVECWDHHGEVDRQSRQAFYPANHEWFQQKWGMSVFDMKNRLGAHAVSAPVLPEINWYPWYQL